MYVAVRRRISGAWTAVLQERQHPKIEHLGDLRGGEHSQHSQYTRR